MIPPIVLSKKQDDIEMAYDAIKIIVEDTGKQHEDHIYRFSPGIKDQTAQKQQQIAELSRYQVVDQYENRKKAEYKKYTVEYHIKSSPICRYQVRGKMLFDPNII